MSTQVTVRLPDILVAYIDQQVRAGAATSRADAIAAALRTQARKLAAERDATIYAAAAADPDTDALAAYAAAQSMDIA